MKKLTMMKLTTLALATLLVGGAPLAIAEKGEGGNRGDKHERRAAHMQEQFGVSDEQLSQMREIRENGGSREDVRGVLTDDQRAQMKAWRQEHGRGHKGKREGTAE